MATNTHKDIEFAVDIRGGQKIFKNFEKAVLAAFYEAFAFETSSVDVLVHSEAAAKSWQGEYGVDQYREDPDASVFQRLEIKVNNAGKIP